MLAQFSPFAAHLAKKPLLRHAIFLGLALLAIWVNGYHFGTFDQVIHLPFLKKFADPGLYPADAFLALRTEHYSFFWLMFIPAWRLGILEPVMFTVHVLATYGLVWMFWELTDTLFHNPLADLFSIALLVMPHFGLSGFEIVEFSLLNRTFVLPFILSAFILHLRRRSGLAFLLLGLMFNLHVIYAGFGVLMVLFELLLRVKESGWKTLLKGLAFFLLGALPVLVWRLTRGGPLDLQVRPDVLKLAASALLAGVYYVFQASPQVLISGLHGLATLAFFLLGWRARLSVHDRSMRNFVLAIGLVLLVQLISTYWLPVIFILQLQILRIGYFLLLIGYIYFAGYLASRLQQGSLAGLSGGLVAFGFITFPSPLLPLGLLAISGWLAKRRWRAWTGLVGYCLTGIGTMAACLASGVWSPGYFLYEPKSAWTQAQDWARQNTPREAMFITPPQILKHYIPDWRTFSERGTLASLVEIFEFPHPDYIPYWQERFEALAPGAIAQFNGNYEDTFAFTKQAYYSLMPQDYLRIARKYGVRYLVIEKPHLQPFAPVYENEGFVIYDLQGK